VKVPVNPTSTDLTALESALAASIANLGEGKALALLARDRTVVHREGRNSAVGKAAIGQLPSDPVEYRWTLARSEVATSGDLGYTCGTAEIITKDGVVRQNTLRIWTRDGDGRWILAVDVAIPGEKPAAPR
jgi:ketosteroid isomerase-like protein